ncbi:MAG: hypothetical protein IT270_16865 [Saprospiraceae bacterium]|nr:hypothetical protein [Saprospiraceae bacterium]
MKHLLIAVSFLLVIQQLQAQAPFYMLYDSTCMDLLQYKLSSNGSTVKAFGVHAGNNEQYLLRTGDPTETMTSLPKGTMVCGSLILGEELMQAVNLKLRPTYMLFPNESGFSTLPVTVVSHFKRSGSVIHVKSDKYAFALDTSRLSMEQNLATKDSKTKVYFRDVQPVLCQEKFSYHLEPVLKSDANYRADFEYIPGIGITKMKYITTGDKQEVQTLELINGETVGKHLGKLCKSKSGGSKSEPAKPQVETNNK